MFVGALNRQRQPQFWVNYHLKERHIRTATMVHCSIRNGGLLHLHQVARRGGTIERGQQNEVVGASALCVQIFWQRVASEPID